MCDDHATIKGTIGVKTSKKVRMALRCYCFSWHGHSDDSKYAIGSRGENERIKKEMEGGAN